MSKEKLKIYFAGSIRGGRDDKDLYRKIIELLQNYGEVLTEHVGSRTLSALGEDGPTDSYIFERDVAWLKECDVVVAEVTNPSLGVGYELGLAQGLKKKVICLYRPSAERRLSAMVGGNSNFKVIEYQDLEDLQLPIEQHVQ